VFALGDRRLLELLADEPGELPDERAGLVLVGREELDALAEPEVAGRGVEPVDELRLRVGPGVETGAAAADDRDALGAGGQRVHDVALADGVGAVHVHGEDRRVLDVGARGRPPAVLGERLARALRADERDHGRRDPLGAAAEEPAALVGRRRLEQRLDLAGRALVGRLAELDRARRTRGGAGAAVLAGVPVEVDLVDAGPLDRVVGTGVDAGRTALLARGAGGTDVHPEVEVVGTVVAAEQGLDRRDRGGVDVAGVEADAAAADVAGRRGVDDLVELQAAGRAVHVDGVGRAAVRPRPVGRVRVDVHRAAGDHPVGALADALHTGDAVLGDPGLQRERESAEAAVDADDAAALDGHLVEVLAAGQLRAVGDQRHVGVPRERDGGLGVADDGDRLARLGPVAPVDVLVPEARVGGVREARGLVGRRALLVDPAGPLALVDELDGVRVETVVRGGVAQAVLHARLGASDDQLVELVLLDDVFHARAAVATEHARAGGDLDVADALPGVLQVDVAGVRTRADEGPRFHFACRYTSSGIDVASPVSDGFVT